MQLIFYKTDNPDNVINKKFDVGLNIDINLKSDIDVTYPSIKLMQFEGDDFEQYNYVFISGLNRYYFINKITKINNRVIEISFTCDVLETYKQDILKSNARFKRKLKHGDYLDVPLELSAKTTVIKYESNKEIFNDGNTLILTTLGV